MKDEVWCASRLVGNGRRLEIGSAKDSALICGWPDFGGNDNYESEAEVRRSAARGETTGSVDGPPRQFLRLPGPKVSG
jgi:hypothetical protein